MTCRVADSNEDYTGSATYAFTIGRRAAAVKADFVKKGFFADVPADSFYYEAAPDFLMVRDDTNAYAIEM